MLPDPPTLIEAAQDGAQVLLTFDRPITLTSPATEPPWFSDAGTLSSATQVGVDEITIDISETITTISYTGAPGTVVGDPDGVPLGPIVGFPVP